MSDKGFMHGKSIEEIVEIRFKEYEMRKLREREELENLRKLRENKADVTAPKAVQTAPAPHAHPVLDKIKHALHLDR